MSQDDVTQIRVGNASIGIMGLTKVMEEMTEGWAEKSDKEVQDELLKRLSKRNYIPDKVKESYGTAFLREFKKFLGKPYEEDVSEGLEIRVLGQGCAQCDGLTMAIQEVMAEMKLAADLEHVTDIKEIGKYGVMGAPALIINGKVMSVGRVPTRSQLTAWLAEAKG